MNFDLKQKLQNTLTPNVLAKKPEPVELTQEQQVKVVQEALGVKFPTQEEKDYATRLITGASMLMHDRLTGKNEFPIAQWQFDRWTESIQNLSKAFVYGQIQYEDLVEFVEGTINMGYVEVEPEKPTFEETTGEQGE